MRRPSREGKGGGDYNAKINNVNAKQKEGKQVMLWRNKAEGIMREREIILGAKGIGSGVRVKCMVGVNGMARWE